MIWTKQPNPIGGNCGASWYHISGWIIQHCGHPTALWPYYLVQPDGGSVVSFNGRGFKSVAAAQSVVAGILGGFFQVTTEGCVENLSRVDADTFGCLHSIRK